MLRFKGYTILAMSLFAFVGCFKPANDRARIEELFGESDSAATFFVSALSGETQAPKDTQTQWRVPLQKTFLFKACLGERMGLRNLQGHKFQIENVQTGEMTDVKLTANDGCLRWDESFHYNYFAYRPYYIEIHRRIHGAGTHSGRVNMRIAINPWAGDRGGRDQSVVFLQARDGSGKLDPASQIDLSQVVKPDQALAALEGRLTAERPKLWMARVAPLITIDQVDSRGAFDGVQLRMLSEMRAEVQVEDLKGARYRIPLTNGTFEVGTQLLGAQLGPKRDQHTILTPSMGRSTGIIVNENIEVATTMVMTTKATRSNLEMLLRVRPLGAPGEIEPFEAVYVLGDIERVVGGQSPRLKPEMYGSEDKPFDVASYVESATNYQELIKNRSAYKLQPYVMDIAKVMFAGIQPGETSTQRTVEYQVEVCVRDFLTGRRVEFQRFDIVDEATGQVLQYKNNKGELEPTMTNQMGCLIWTSSVTHKYYKPEDYVFPKFTIKSPAGDFSLTKSLLVNPWDAMFRTFGWDKDQFTDEFIAGIQARKKEPSRLYIPNFSYHTLRFRYEIDRFMNLEVKKAILLNLHPKVLRYNAIIDGRKRTEDLRDGIYRLKVAFQKDYLDPANKGLKLYPGLDSSGKMTTQYSAGHSEALQTRRFITVVDKLVRVNAGQIATPVEFSIQDLRLMRVRAQMMIQIETIDEKALQAANVMDAEFNQWLRSTETWLKEEADPARKLNDSEFRAKKDEYRKHVERVLGEVRELNRLYDKKFSFEGVQVPASLEAQIADIEAKIQEALKLNDFTVAPAAPVVNLDTLVEKDSGLGRRTFLGPIIFLSNAYGDDLRPTDNIDEKFCAEVDCNALNIYEKPNAAKSDFYENSPYFGSVKHLAQMQVDDLIQEYLQQRQMYQKTMPVMASVYNFLKFYNLDFVSLGDETLERLSTNCPSGNFENCVEKTDDRTWRADHFLAMLNDNPGVDQLRSNLGYNLLAPQVWKSKGYLEPVSREDLRRAIVEAKMTPALSVRLCGMLAGQLPDTRIGGLRSARSLAYEGCVKRFAKDVNSTFVLDRKLRVFKTGGYIFKGGKQMNFNVGANFNLNHSTKFGFGTSVGYSDIAKNVVGALPLVGSMAKTALSPLGIKNSLDFDRSKSDGTAISEQTYLVGQFATFNLELKEFERCLVMRLHPSIMDAVGRSVERAIMPESEKEAIALSLNRGVYMCSGEHETVPKEVTEHYFYFTQHFTEGDMLDQADLYNHPWLLGLRGMRDFSTFVYQLRAQDFRLTAVFDPVVEKPAWPLEKMVETYRGFLPSFHGIYTMLEGDEMLPEYPLPEGTSTKFFNGLNPIHK